MLQDHPTRPEVAENDPIFFKERHKMQLLSADNYGMAYFQTRTVHEEN